MNYDEFRALSKDKRDEMISRLSLDDARKLVEGIRKIQEIESRTKFYRMFPDAGPLRRELYPHQTQFFADGKWAQARSFVGGNGTGKTEAGGFELTAHTTGQYPSWWEGHDFGRPILAWIGGDTIKTARDIIQKKLFGSDDHRHSDFGTGIIPRDCIGKVTPSNQLTGLIDKVRIKHTSGRWSTVQLKSYDQGRDAWQGAEPNFVWLDEQAPTDIYEESITRFRGGSADGRLILTFTGLKGATDVVLLFLPELTDKVDHKSMREAGRARVVCPMDEVPHLSKEQVTQLLANYTGLIRETRRTGIPYAGSGRVYAVDEDAFVVDPFKIPDHFALISGADFGYGSEDGGGGTAAVWGAYDRQNETIYIYDEYFRAQAEAPVHASALKKHGDWIPCEGDYAGVAISEEGRGKVVDVYRKLGVNIRPAVKDVESGIRTVETMLSQSKLRIFRTCTGLIQEYRMYNRDERGKIIKKNDHRLDALRYLVMGIKHAKTKPIPKHNSATSELTFGFYS